MSIRRGRASAGPAPAVDGAVPQGFRLFRHGCHQQCLGRTARTTQSSVSFALATFGQSVRSASFSDAGNCRREEMGPDVLERPPGRLLTQVFVPELNVATWLPQAALAVRRLVSRGNHDCIVTSSPPESSHLVGLLLGGKRPAWVADFRDGWTFEPYRVPFPTGVQRRLDLHLERRVVRSAEVVVGATRPLADDLSRRLGAFATCVMNGWDRANIPHRSRTLEIRVIVGPGSSTRGDSSGEWGRDPAPLLQALRAVSAETEGPQLGCSRRAPHDRGAGADRPQRRR